MDWRVQASFSKMGIDVEAENADGLFSLLDFGGDGQLEIEEFAAALQQINGTARSIDVVKLKHDTKNLGRLIRSLQNDLQKQFAMQLEYMQCLYTDFDVVKHSKDAGKSQASGCDDELPPVRETTDASSLRKCL